MKKNMVFVINDSKLLLSNLDDIFLQFDNAQDRPQPYDFTDMTFERAQFERKLMKFFILLFFSCKPR